MKRLYIISLTIILFSTVFGQAQTNMEMLGHLPYTEQLSDIWGYTDEEGNEYALVGTYGGLSIVDVTDPENPIEVFFGSGLNSIWRDIKTWGDYAYVSNESGGGVYIVDLSPLPGTITETSDFSGIAYPFTSIHNLFIDEYGKLYIFGANNGVGGAIICDLTADPMNPVELGRFNEFYLHDGMARGDTLWGGGIYMGVLAAIDVSNPSEPVIMGTVDTPSQFCHNAWVSDDGSHVFTTDEVSSGYIGAYDVTDLENMIETDRIQKAPGTGVIPHNAHVLNDFIITSYYTEGVTIHDASNPSNIIETGHYDTSPNYSGSGYNGCWGVYPFLPSGNILASDMEEGLYILSANYTRASFLEGMVTDSLSGDPLFNVEVEVVGTELVTQTAFDGTYQFGTTISGDFDVKFSKDEFMSKVIEGVNIINGEIVQLDVVLSSAVISDIGNNTVFSEFRLYPNPFESKISLDYSLIQEEGKKIEIEIYNMMGTNIQTLRLAHTNGKVEFGEDLSPGIYFVVGGTASAQLQAHRIIKK